MIQNQHEWLLYLEQLKKKDCSDCKRPDRVCVCGYAMGYPVPSYVRPKKPNEICRECGTRYNRACGCHPGMINKCGTCGHGCVEED